MSTEPVSASASVPTAPEPPAGLAVPVVAAEAVAREEVPVGLAPSRPPVRLAELGALLGMVISADVCLYSGAGGVGAGVLLTTAATLLLAVAPARRLSTRLWVLGALVLALSARSVWSGDVWTFLLGLGAVFSFGVALRTRRSFVPELAASALFSVGGAFVSLWDYFAATVRLATGGRLRHVRWATIVVPVLVVASFALVFTAANPLIERWAGQAWDAVRLGDLLSIPRFGFWLLVALVGAGLLAPRLRELALSERFGPGHRIEEDLAPPVDTSVAIARNVLLGVNLLFLAYNALDAVYLWAGTPPPGLDHTTYAHRGTAWLTVSLLMSTVVLGFIFRGGMNAQARETWLVRVLGLAWAGQNFVLAAGTFRRIAMYIDDSGLTMLRCLGIAGVVVVAVAFALIVLKVARRHTTLWLLRRQLDAFLIALALWTVLPVDTMVWSFNVARIEQGQDKPLLHLFEQKISAEAVPEVIALLDHPDPMISAGVADRMAWLRPSLMEQQSRARRWTQADLAVGRALAALQSAGGRLDALRPDDAAGAGAAEALRVRAFQANGMDPSLPTRWSF